MELQLSWKQKSLPRISRCSVEVVVQMGGMQKRTKERKASHRMNEPLYLHDIIYFQPRLCLLWTEINLWTGISCGCRNMNNDFIALKRLTLNTYCTRLASCSVQSLTQFSIATPPFLWYRRLIHSLPPSINRVGLPIVPKLPWVES